MYLSYFYTTDLGWSEQESAPAAPSSPSSLPKRSRKATTTPGNPQVPPAESVLSKDSPGGAKEGGTDHNRIMVPGNLRFQRDGFLPYPGSFVPNHPVLQIQPSCPDPTRRWRGTLSPKEEPAQVSWTVGPERLQCQIKEEIFNCQRSFASTLHMMSRKVQKILFLFCRESGRRTPMFKCITAFFTAL